MRVLGNLDVISFWNGLPDAFKKCMGLWFDCEGRKGLESRKRARLECGNEVPMLSFTWGDFSDCLRPLMTTTVEVHDDMSRWTSHPQGQNELHILKDTTLEKTNAGLTVVIKSYCKGLPEDYTFEVLNKARVADPSGRAKALQRMSDRGQIGAKKSHEAAKIAGMTVDELLREPEDVVRAWLTAGAVNRGYASFAAQAARHAGMLAGAFGDLELDSQMKIVRSIAQSLAKKSNEAQAAKIAGMTVKELVSQPEDVLRAWLTAGAVNRGYAAFAAEAARHAGITAAAFGDLDIDAQMKIVRAMAQALAKTNETKRREAYCDRLQVHKWTDLTPEQQAAAFLLSEFPHLQRGHVTQSASAAANRASVCQMFTQYGMAFAHFILVSLPSLCRLEDNWAQKKLAIFG
jgi:hypothetical protein